MPLEYLLLLLGMGFALSGGVVGTVRWYLKQRIDADAKRDSLAGPGIEAIHLLEDRIAELEERVDFHERVIDGQRKELGQGRETV